MEGSSRLSTVFFAVILSPAVLQSSDCGSGGGDVLATELTLLELEAGGQNRVVGFGPDRFLYEVWVPELQGVATVRAQSLDSSSALTVSYQGQDWSIGSGTGELDIDVALGLTTVVVKVAAPGGAVRSYQLHVTRDLTPGPCNWGAANSQVVTVGCAVVETTEGIAQPILNYELSVEAGPITAGKPFTATLGGVAVVDEFILDVLQSPLVSGGSPQLELWDVAATVQVRSGATGADVPLTVDVSALVPGPTSLCAIAPSTTTVCDPANDVNPSDPSAGNTDCQPVFPGNQCGPDVNLVDLPISTDGPTCAALGSTKDDQFLRNGFCVTGPLSIPLASQTKSYTADPSGGEVLWGWADQGVPGLVLCPDASEPRCASSGGTIPDGAYAVPIAGFADPTGPIGARVHRAGLLVPQNCVMATQRVYGSGVPIPEVVEPTPDRDLIACAIHPPECTDNSDCPGGYNCVQSPPSSCFNGGGSCQVVPGVCTGDYNPVCGCDGITYSNYCDSLVSGVRASAAGACDCTENTDCDSSEYCNALTCDGPGSCTARPVFCLPGAGDVTACDGLDYDSVCAAAEAGARVAGELYPSPF